MGGRSHMSAPIGSYELPVELRKWVAFGQREPPEPYAWGILMIDHASVV